jgi:hypothetical protein
LLIILRHLDIRFPSCQTCCSPILSLFFFNYFAIVASLIIINRLIVNKNELEFNLLIEDYPWRNTGMTGKYRMTISSIKIG